MGLDPVPERLPSSLSGRDQTERVLAFCLEVVEHTKDLAPAYKLNTAYFEALGHRGWDALGQLTERIPADRIIILDAKRGDIGHTAQRYATALFERLRCDAVTLNPLMGLETLEPFLSNESKAAYVLALTSNPGASQYLLSPMRDGRMLCEHIAADLRNLRSSADVGMVVGATQPGPAAAVLKAFPQAPLLIPGVGAQGGDAPKWLGLLAGHTGLPLFNASRSILYPGKATDNPPPAASRDLFHDPFGPIREAAERTRNLLLPIADRFLQSGTPAESESDRGSEHELKAETAPAPSEPRAASAPALGRTPNSPSPARVFTVYTDGACSGNPGPGGWAALIRHDGHETQISGGEPATTNNRMEMRAVLEALNAISDPALVRIHSDSALIINAFTQGWIDRWIRNGWRKADRKPVENQGLWQDILRAMTPHRVDWIKVKGHHDDHLNNRVDELAVAESRKFS